MECPISPRVSNRSLISTPSSSPETLLGRRVLPAATSDQRAFPDAASPHATLPGLTVVDSPGAVCVRFGLRLDARAENKKPGPPTRFSVLDHRVAWTVRGSACHIVF